MPTAMNTTLSTLQLPVRWYWAGVARMVDASGRDERTLVDRCQLCVRIFYGYVFMLAFRLSAYSVTRFWKNDSWPDKLSLWLSDLFPVAQWQLVSLVATLTVAVASVLCMLWPSLRLPRIAVAVALPVYWAIQFDMKGKIDHGQHLVFWTAIAFAALPSLPSASTAEPSRLRAYVGMFVGAQAFIGLTYTCAGICKLLGAYYDFSEGMTWFHPDALPLHIAAGWKRAEATLLGPVLITRPGLSFVLNQLTLYLELCALAAVFSPHVMRLWGVALLGMHLSIMLTMNISFGNGVMPLVLLLVVSPLAPDRFQLRAMLEGLPVIGFVIRRLRGDKAGPVGMDAADAVRSRFVRWCVPGALVIYFLVGFSRFEPARPRFGQDIFPISAMPMFWRTRNDAKNVARLAKIRDELATGDHSTLQRYVPPKPKPRSKSNKRK